MDKWKRRRITEQDRKTNRKETEKEKEKETESIRITEQKRNRWIDCIVLSAVEQSRSVCETSDHNVVVIELPGMIEPHSCVSL